LSPWSYFGLRLYLTPANTSGLPFGEAGQRRTDDSDGARVRRDAATESGGEWIRTDRGFARFLARRWRHPLAFYRALGYTLVGVVPDANGPGKPDLLLAKRVG
jgi:hypothetical protein